MTASWHTLNFNANAERFWLTVCRELVLQFKCVPVTRSSCFAIAFKLSITWLVTSKKFELSIVYSFETSIKCARSGKRSSSVTFCVSHAQTFPQRLIPLNQTYHKLITTNKNIFHSPFIINTLRYLLPENDFLPIILFHGC